MSFTAHHVETRIDSSLTLRVRAPAGLIALAIAAIGALLFASAAVSAEEPNPHCNAYFGETHLHTSWSSDAWVFGNRLTGPADAYKYAKGETIPHPLGYPTANRKNKPRIPLPVR
jgi:hypothetical protein